MRMEQLEIFIVLANCKSMNVAAEQLHTSQQNISKTIKEIEQEYEQEFFIRSKKGVALTSEGKIMYEFAKKEWNDFNAVKDNINKLLIQKVSGTLAIAVMNSGSSMILPQFLCTCFKEYPNVQLKINDTNLESVLKSVQSEKVDFGIISCIKNKGAIVPEIPNDLDFFPLIRGKSFFWVAEWSKYAKKGGITFKEANDATIIVDNAIDLDLLKRLFELKGEVLQVSAQSKSLVLLAQLILDGKGVFPDMCFEAYDNELLYKYVFGQRTGLVAVPVFEEQELEIEVGVVVPKKKKQKFLVTFAMNYLKNMNFESLRRSR